MTPANPPAPLPAARPALAHAYLLIAITWLVLGVGLGMAMGFREDFRLTPVHAHANLLGWVTNALFGLFFWLSGHPVGRAHWLMFALFNVGSLLMLVGITGKLTSLPVPEALIGVGALMVAAAVLHMAGTIIGAVSMCRG